MPGTPAAVAVPLLVDRHGPKLFALASRLCGNASDAEDMVQDVFLQAFRKWSTFKGESDPGTWLYAIAARSCKARTRRKGGIDRRMPAVSQLMPWNDSTVVDLGVSRSTPAAQVIERESARAVHDAIVALPSNFRVPLVLKEMLELPIEEVGQALNLKPQTVKTRVHRARLLLRKAILAKKSIPKKTAPAPNYEMQVCADLLSAKMDAMDHGRGFPIGQKVICDRCRSVFAELDLAQNTCARLAAGDLPKALRDRIVRSIKQTS
ncbi:MAG: RNA polymerase sigma factor [Phycisphaeraceae bacterium]|nr:RNA polymerase sigma factor [Phycisphaeraceae bacterium]